MSNDLIDRYLECGGEARQSLNLDSLLAPKYAAEFCRIHARVTRHLANCPPTQQGPYFATYESLVAAARGLGKWTGAYLGGEQGEAGLGEADARGDLGAGERKRFVAWYE